MARATPGRNWVVLDVAARHRMVVRTESLRIPNRHDTGSASPRSVGEVALIWDTISHYSPVLIAPLAINSSRRDALFFLREFGCRTAEVRRGLTARPPRYDFAHPTPQQCCRP